MGFRPYVPNILLQIQKLAAKKYNQTMFIKNIIILNFFIFKKVRCIFMTTLNNQPNINLFWYSIKLLIIWKYQEITFIDKSTTTFKLNLKHTSFS